MKKYVILSAYIAKIVLALGSLHLLANYLFNRLVHIEQMTIHGQYDELPAFRELFKGYGCDTFSQFLSYLDSHQHIKEEWVFVDGSVKQMPVARYDGAAEIAHNEFEMLQNNPFYQMIHYPDAVLDPTFFAMLVMLPILIFIGYAVIKMLYDRSNMRDGHSLFLSGNVVNTRVPYSGMNRYHTGLGTDQQIISADYNTIADEYSRLKHLCKQNPWEWQRFKSIRKIVKSIANKGRQRYLLGNLIRRSGNAFLLFGTLIIMGLFFIDFLATAMMRTPPPILYVFGGELDVTLQYYVMEPQFIMYPWLLLLIPIGLVLKMVSRILIQLKDDDIRCRLTQKMMVQEFTEEQAFMMNRAANEYPLEDLIQFTPNGGYYDGPR